MGSERVGGWVCVTVEVRVVWTECLKKAVQWDFHQAGRWGDVAVDCWDGLEERKSEAMTGSWRVVGTAFGTRGNEVAE